MRFLRESNSLKIIFLSFVLLLIPLSQQAQNYYLDRNLIPVWGGDDYRSSLFLNATSQDSLPPFEVFFDWAVYSIAVDETDTSGFFRYIVIGIDSINSYINQDYYHRKEEIGQTILDILELHRREMLSVFFTHIKEASGDAEAANLVAAVIVGALQVSLGMFPTALGAPAGVDDPEWIQIIEDIKVSCDNTLNRYKQELTELQPTILFSVRDSVRRELRLKESGVLHTYSKNFYGFSMSLGTQSNAIIGRLQSPASFSAIRPVFVLGLHVNKWHLNGTLGGLSFDEQSDIQMGDVTLQDEKRNLAIMGHVSLSYAFKLSNRWRLLPEISRVRIAFSESSDDEEKDSKLFDVYNWGWGARFQQHLTSIKEYGLRHVHFSDVGIEYFFRHNLYSIPNVGRGHMFTFGLSVYLGTNIHRKHTVLK